MSKPAPDDVRRAQQHPRFTREAEGLWKYLVIAQDVNIARPDMTPEQAARIVGGSCARTS